MSYFRLNLDFLKTATAAALLVASFSLSATAQEPTDQVDKSQGKLRGLVMQALREQSYPVGLSQQDFKKYFWGFVLPNFVQQANRTKLPEVRKDLRLYFMTGKVGSVHMHLNDLTLDWMVDVIRDTKKQWGMEFKVNAMLEIGELNSKEADVAAKSPAVPYPRALSLALLNAARSPRAPDALRVAALVGIQRHAESHAWAPLAGESTVNITTTMLEILKDQQPPPGRNAGGHNWIRRSAVQTLGALGNPGTNNDVVVALETIVSDSNGPLAVRCAAAQALGELKYQGNKPDFAKLMNHVGQLTADACGHHVAAFKQKTDYPLKRSLKSCLYPVHLGVVGPDEKSGLLAAATGSPQQVAATALAGKVEAVWKVFDNINLDGTSLATELEGKVADLKRSLSPQGPAAKAGLAADTERTAVPVAGN